jgi:hypothetical protein
MGDMIGLRKNDVLPFYRLLGNISCLDLQKQIRGARELIVKMYMDV